MKEIKKRGKVFGLTSPLFASLLIFIIIVACTPSAEKINTEGTTEILSKYPFLFTNLTDINIFDFNGVNCFKSPGKICVYGEKDCYCDLKAKAQAKTMAFDEDLINEMGAFAEQVDCDIMIARTSCNACGKSVQCSSNWSRDNYSFNALVENHASNIDLGKNINAIIIKGNITSQDTIAKFPFFTQQANGKLIAFDNCLVYYKKFFWSSLTVPRTEEEYAKSLCKQ